MHVCCACRVANKLHASQAAQPKLHVHAPEPGGPGRVGQPPAHARVRPHSQSCMCLRLRPGRALQAGGCWVRKLRGACAAACTAATWCSCRTSCAPASTSMRCAASLPHSEVPSGRQLRVRARWHVSHCRALPGRKKCMPQPWRLAETVGLPASAVGDDSEVHCEAPTGGTLDVSGHV